jgi:hypothetical protein
VLTEGLSVRLSESSRFQRLSERRLRFADGFLRPIEFTPYTKVQMDCTYVSEAAT